MTPTRTLLSQAAARLAAAGIERPAAEARLLLAHATGRTQTELATTPDHPLPPEPFATLVARRITREPLAHITGHQGFWQQTLAVSPVTLIPRADSETLIEAALAARPAHTVHFILDLGTGTGALLLAALSEYPAAWGIGTDRIPAAATLAAANARTAGLAPRCAFLAADWAAPLAARFDLVLCNPPYIPTADIPTLMPEVATHEPASALDGGADGLDAYRTLLPLLPALLTSTGLAILELGAGQAPDVCTLATLHGLTPALRNDLSGHPRALLLTLP